MINKYTHEKQIIVIGGGSWGSAIADQLQKAGNNVTVLVRRQETADALSQSRVLTLPQVTLKHPLTSTTQPECLRSAELIVIAVPLSATKDTMTMVKHYTSPNAVILFTGKGLLPASHKGGIFLPEWVDTHLPSFDQFALLSGPSFADEVIADKPTAVMIASNSLPLSAKVSEYFSSSCLRCYIGDDVIGVALGGAAKNVIAIAAGIATGLDLGDNARAALVTRGLAEIKRLGERIGGQAETLNGLAGIGDLMLSCSGPHSRNMAYGMALAKKQAPADKLAEGSKAAKLLIERAHFEKIELPIAQAVYTILQHPELIEDIINALLSRTVNTE
ncbi:NAD(P)-dependent glycerol-3-phosphate dehydrogenase [Alphaproteobacteria bacterium]|nr:NAD(P)-dependent glycerol-3-phosphate dehydrogenase [Alphaproteobacteria bacterium]MDC0462106.1 NAD(P)-dependent glycerol-3-phosphate dehydrogenase [Alphaproteobacteria bacterium]